MPDASPAPLPAPAQQQHGPPVVLVAEDERSVREMVALVLRSSGYGVLLCEDGRGAIEALDGPGRIDAALLDLRMPCVGGVQVVEHIRGHEFRRSLPVVAMSAYNDEQQQREVLSAGADRFLAKPFTISDLVEALEALIHRPR